jgi:hypothetical protein
MSKKYTDEELEFYGIEPEKYTCHGMDFDNAVEFIDELNTLPDRYGVSFENIRIDSDWRGDVEAVIFAHKTDEEIEEEIAGIKDIERVKKEYIAKRYEEYLKLKKKFGD